MNDKLTKKQLLDLIAFHNNAVTGRMPTSKRNRTRVVTDPEEIAKLEPRVILSEYVIRINRASAKGDEQQED